MPPDNPAKITIKRRERDAVLQALQAGLVPRQGLHLIQVGRKAEISALISDLDRIAEGGAAFRLVAGRFGSGKTFFLSLLRSLALQKGLVVAQADFNMERRLYSADGHGRALYSELMGNLCLRAQPDGGALPTVLASWVSKIQYEVMTAGGDAAALDARLALDLRDLQGLVGGSEFSEVLRLFYRSHGKDEKIQACALRWLKAEYTSKIEARADLGVRRIIDDANLYDSLKLMAAFVRKAGFNGLLVAFDELVVISHRLPSTRARQANYEALLAIINDSFQGTSAGLGFVLAGTDECLQDKRRGLYSYEALRTRLTENTLAREGLVDLSGPVIRLNALTPEDLFILLKNIAFLHANGDPARVLVPDEGVVAILANANRKLGSDYFRTPRDIVRSFVGLLNLLEQNPDKTWADILEVEPLELPALPFSAEEELDRGAAPSIDEDLALVRL